MPQSPRQDIITHRLAWLVLIGCFELQGGTALQEHGVLLQNLAAGGFLGIVACWPGCFQGGQLILWCSYAGVLGLVLFWWKLSWAQSASNMSIYHACRGDLIGQVYPFNSCDNHEISLTGIG